MLIKIILCLTLVSVSTGLEWIDEDAVYIEDGAVPKPSKMSHGLRKVDQIENNGTTMASPPPPPPPVTAIPVEIVLGQCVKASSCYPILFYSESLSENQEQRVVDKNLVKFILSTANYCEPSDLPPQMLDKNGRSDLPSDDVYIWCPIRTFSTTKPEVVVLSRSNSTIEMEESSTSTSISPEVNVECGPVKTNQDEDEDYAQLRVVGGQDAAVGEFPHMVALTNKGKHFCSGTLIDDRHVLLAAHCVSHLRRKDLKNIRALIGDHNIKDPIDVVHQERNISAVIFHSNFSMRSVRSDIGMAYLSHPVTFGDNVAPICLSAGAGEPSTDFEDGSTYGILTGWGQVGENKTASPTLMKTKLRIWRREECAEKYKGKIPGGLSKQMVCASSTAPVLKDACKGDSGGPLQLVRNNKVEQIGIVSFGIGCGQFPGVFTKVADFLDWIEKHRIRSSNYFDNSS